MVTLGTVVGAKASGSMSLSSAKVSLTLGVKRLPRDKRRQTRRANDAAPSLRKTVIAMAA